MKKTIAAVTSVLLLFSALTFSSFAGNTAPTSESVKKEMQGAAAYVMAQYLEHTAEGMMYTNAQYITSIVSSGIACDELAQRYQKDLKGVLDANAGKLIYSGSESAGSYALAIEALEAMGSNPADFYGYNLFAALSGVTVLDSNPYMLVYALSTVTSHTKDITNTQLEDALLNAILALFEENGAEAGWNNWGINVDNNGAIIPALAPYYAANETVKRQIDKALAYNETMKTKEGYTNWGSANANSTALALEALSAMKDYKKAEEAYTLLLTFKAADESGAYTYQGDANLYATAGALEGMRYYAAALAEKEEAERPSQPSTKPGETNGQEVGAKPGSGQTIDDPQPPETGDGSGWFLFAGVFAFAGTAGAAALKKKTAEG